MTDSRPSPAAAPARTCRSCGAPLERMFVDLGMSPPCEDFLTADRLQSSETFYPMDVRVCDACLLVQMPTYISATDNFSEYAYFSSYSDTWVEHARRYVMDRVDELQLGPQSRVIEIASNDGYLLQHAKAQGLQGPRDRAGHECRRRGDRARDPDLERVPDRRVRAGGGRDLRSGGSRRREQRLRARARPQRLHGRPCAAARGRTDC